MIEISAKRLKHYWPCYFLILPALALVLLFSYFPIYNGFVHIFYRWNGNNIEEYIGLGNIIKVFSDPVLLKSFGTVLILIVANLFKMIPAIFAAVILHHIINERMQYVYRVFFIIPMVVPYMVVILMWKYFYEPNTGVINSLLRTCGILAPTETIQWLSDVSLCLPAIIFQGFPWIGAFSVLLYLAGLQNIPKEIYESAGLDGAGPVRIFWNIELPMIMTQVRISLVLMIIYTIQGWEYIYIFLGESGGPKGVANVPGLVIFREAFSKGFFGYGCAIGFVLFGITLILTWINNRYVKVNK